jgi:hypothetical protein
MVIGRAQSDALIGIRCPLQLSRYACKYVNTAYLSHILAANTRKLFSLIYCRIINLHYLNDNDETWFYNRNHLPLSIRIIRKGKSKSAEVY